jgi:hypothetical protein
LPRGYWIRFVFDAVRLFHSLTSEPQAIAHGVTNAVTSEQVITFPSMCRHAREIKFRADDLAANYPGDQIIDDDGNGFVGDLALSQLPPDEQLRLPDAP